MRNLQFITLVGLILSGVLFHLNAEETRPLNREQCQLLFTHQFEVVRKDPANPLLRSMNISKDQLESLEARKAELDFCQKEIPPSNFHCQMQAQNLQSLILCYQKYPVNSSTTKIDPGQATHDDAKHESESNRPRENIDTQSAQEAQANLQPRSLPQNQIPVNAGNCQKGYQHMYGLLSKAPDLLKSDHRQKLLAHWQSSAARAAFSKRCMRDFTANDMGCILESQDREILQACLLVVP